MLLPQQPWFTLDIYLSVNILPGGTPFSQVMHCMLLQKMFPFQSIKPFNLYHIGDYSGMDEIGTRHKERHEEFDHGPSANSVAL